MKYDAAEAAAKLDELMLRLRAFSYPVYPSYYRSLQTHDTRGAFGYPRCQRVNFYRLVNLVKYISFCKDVDYHPDNKKRGPVNRCDKDTAWFRVCLRKFFQYDSRPKHKQDGEDLTRNKHKCLNRAFEQMRNSDAERYWRDKGHKFPESDIVGYEYNEVDHAPARYDSNGNFIGTLQHSEQTPDDGISNLSDQARAMKIKSDDEDGEKSGSGADRNSHNGKYEVNEEDDMDGIDYEIKHKGENTSMAHLEQGVSQMELGGSGSMQE